jgi:hypothetical protein
MKQSFEDKHRKPVKPGGIITMAEFLKKRVERVILTRKNKRIFMQHA